MTSTGSAGDCYDNAMAESFFATLECELIDRRSFQTQAEARMAIFRFTEGWYNTSRRHSGLGYLSPNEFERRAAAPARQAHGKAPGRNRTGLGPCQIDRPALLGTVFAYLMMLAFLTDPCQQRCCTLFQAAQAKAGRACCFRERLRALFFNVFLTDWETLYKALASRVKWVVVHDTSQDLRLGRVCDEQGLQGTA